MAKKFEIDEENRLLSYNGKEKQVIIPEGVVSIGEKAFWQNGRIEEVVLPQSCISLERSVFFHCRNLKKVTIKGPLKSIGNDAFWGCESLEELFLPDTITEIGNRAISISALKSLHMPKNLVKVGKEPFASWSGTVENLEEITIDKDAVAFTVVDNVLFNKDKTTLFLYLSSKKEEEYIVPDTVAVIGENAFYKCKSLKSVVLPRSVREIKSNAFYYCDSLEKLELNEGLEAIGFQVFGECKKLKSVGRLPQSIRTIEGYAFFNCRSLEEVNIPGGVLSVGNDSFGQCYALKKVTVEEGVKKIDFLGCLSNVKTVYIPASVEEITAINCNENIVVAEDNQHYLSVDGVLYNKDKTELIKYAGSEDKTVFIVPSSVKVIKESSFANNQTLEKVILQNGVTHIEKNAFSSTEKLITVEMSSTLKSIGAEAFCGSSIEYLDVPENVTFEVEKEYGREKARHFSDCANLKRITLPSSLKKIYERMFSNCKSLSYITLPANIESIDSYAFGFCYDLKEIIIPEKCKEIGEDCFVFCSSLEKVVIPPSVQKIANGYNSAFENCKCVVIHGESGSYAEKYATMERLKFEPILPADIEEKDGFKIHNASIVKYVREDTDVVIPMEIRSINALAFEGTKLTRVVIHKDVTRISSTAFGKQKSFTIIGERGSYAESFAKSKKIRFLTAEEEEGLSSLPEFEIEDGALISYNGESTKIVIPNEVTRILKGAFKLYSISELNFGKNITHIEDGAFIKSCKIKKLYFDGTYDDIVRSENQIRQLVEGTSSYVKNENDTYRNIIPKKTKMYEVKGMDKRLIIDRLSMDEKELALLVNEINKNSKDGVATQFSFYGGKQNFIFKCSYKDIDKDIVNELISRGSTMVFDDIIIAFNPYKDVKLTEYRRGKIIILEQEGLDGVLKERNDSGVGFTRSGNDVQIGVIPVSTRKIEPSFFDTTNFIIAEYEDTVSKWLSIEGQENISDLVEKGIVRCKDAVVQYLKIDHKQAPAHEAPYYGYAHLGYKYRIRASRAADKCDYWDFIYSLQATVFETCGFMLDVSWCYSDDGDESFSVYDYQVFKQTLFDVESG